MLVSSYTQLKDVLCIKLGKEILTEVLKLFLVYVFAESLNTGIRTSEKSLGSGGGSTSGRAMAFCQGRPGSNPGTDLGFFSVQNCCQSILTGCQAFSNYVL